MFASQRGCRSALAGPGGRLASSTARLLNCLLMLDSSARYQVPPLPWPDFRLPSGPDELLEAVRGPLGRAFGGEQHLRLGGGTDTAPTSTSLSSRTPIATSIGTPAAVSPSISPRAAPLSTASSSTTTARTSASTAVGDTGEAVARPEARAPCGTVFGGRNSPRSSLRPAVARTRKHAAPQLASHERGTRLDRVDSPDLYFKWVARKNDEVCERTRSDGAGLSLPPELRSPVDRIAGQRLLQRDPGVQRRHRDSIGIARFPPGHACFDTDEGAHPQRIVDDIAGQCDVAPRFPRPRAETGSRAESPKDRSPIARRVLVAGTSAARTPLYLQGPRRRSCGLLSASGYKSRTRLSPEST